MRNRFCITYNGSYSSNVRCITRSYNRLEVSTAFRFIALQLVCDCSILSPCEDDRFCRGREFY